MRPNQEKFCKEYVACGNATEAYKKAGYKPKNDESANASAIRLLGNVKVQERIAELNKQVEKESGKIADIVEIQETITSILRRQQPEKVALKIMTEVESYVPSEDGKMRKKRVRQEKPEIVEVPTKNSDVLKAAELLARMKGAFTTDVNINGGLPVIIAGEEAIAD